MSALATAVVTAAPVPARPVSRPREAPELQAEPAPETVAQGATVTGWSFSGAPPPATPPAVPPAPPAVRAGRFGYDFAGVDVHAPVAPPIVHEVLRSDGRPLDRAAQNLLEPRFDADLGAVRLHTDARAAESAEAVGAHAYAVGRDVVFGRGRYAPERLEGIELLAHELAHVLQQRSSTAVPPLPLLIGDDSDPEEAALRRLGVGLARNGSGELVLRRASGNVFTWIAGLFSSIAHWFTDFSPATLQRYLDGLEHNRDIEGDPDSDDKARAIVKAWAADHRAFHLTPLHKQLLVRELLDGPTTESDEDAIMDLLEASDDADVRTILGPKGVDPQQLVDDVDNDAPKQRLGRFFTRRFVGGQAAVLAGRRDLRPYLNLKALTPEQIEAFLDEHFAGQERELARKVVQDLAAVREGEVDFESEDELRVEVFKRVRTSQLMQQSQNTDAFGYPESLPSTCEGFDTSVPPDLSKHARVNKAAKAHWTAAISSPQFIYFFDLTPLGREHAFDALTLLFTPQASFCERTLFHCDYLTSVIQLRAFAETLGQGVFDERVKRGAIQFSLTYFGAEYITAADQASPRGRFAGPASRESVSVQVVRPSSEADLVIGDHVMFWNHLAYDALSMTNPGPWRLENGVLVDKDARNRDLYEGHGAPAVGSRIVPGPKEDILGELLTQYNHYAEEAIDLTRQVEDKQAGADQRLQTRFPQVEHRPSGWVVRELPRNFARRERFYALRQLMSTDDPELIGLRDEIDHTKMGPVERPVESREKPV